MVKAARKTMERDLVIGACAATDHAQDMKIRIRRCEGNKDCWVAVCGPNDFLMTTNYSLDRLIATITERHGSQTVTVVA